MNKKADLKKIIGIMILIVVLITFIVTFFTPKGLFAKAANAVGDWSDNVLSGIMGRGGKSQVAKTFESEMMDSAFYEFAVKLIESKDYAVQNKLCRIDSSYLPIDFLGYEISINIVGSNLFLQLKEVQESQLIGQVTIENLEICIVEGQTEAGNFHDAWLKENPTKQPDLEYRSITGGELVLVGGSEVMEGEESYNLNIHYLYKPEDGKVCFIATDVGDLLSVCGDLFNDQESSDLVDADCIYELEDSMVLCE